MLRCRIQGWYRSGNFKHLNFDKRRSNAEKRLIHATQLVTIIFYPPEVPVRTHVTRWCSGGLRFCACGLTATQAKSTSQVIHIDTMKSAVCLPLLLTFLLTPTLATAQFAGMRARVPADANTLVLINAKKMFGSRIADRQGWQAKRQAAYDSGISSLPPGATEVLLAGRHDLHFGHEALWELGMMKFGEDKDVLGVAKHYGGTIDEISGHSAVRLPDDHFVLQMGPAFMASYTPANRQDVSRWLRQTNISTPGGHLAPYLQEAFTYATKVGTPIIMAMDLGGLVSINEIEERIVKLNALKNVKLPGKQLVSLLQGIQGITLGISIDDSELGAVRVDFADSAEILATVGKPLLIEILENQGAMIEDFREWEPSVSGNTFMLRGNLSEGGTRKLMSVMELPASMTHAVQQANSPGTNNKEQDVLLATQQYWKSLNSLMDDLQNDHSFQSFGQGAIWYDKYARKIDRLPILNVDPELVNFGAKIAATFRNCETLMKGVGMSSALRVSQTGGSGSSGYSNSSYGGYRASMGYGSTPYGPQGMGSGVSAMNASRQQQGSEIAQIHMQERSRGAASLQDIWNQIASATSKERIRLVSKYSADF